LHNSAAASNSKESNNNARKDFSAFTMLISNLFPDHLCVQAECSPNATTRQNSPEEAKTCQKPQRLWFSAPQNQAQWLRFCSEQQISSSLESKLNDNNGSRLGRLDGMFTILHHFTS
jgi:hypothetical protein